MQQGPQRAVVVGTAAAACLLLAAAPTPLRCWRTLTDAAGSPAAGADPWTALVALLALVAWGLATWLAATILLTAGGHLPGHAGRVLGAAARRAAPAAVRGSVEVALGLGVVVGALAGPAAAATPGQEPAAPAPVLSLDWAAPAPLPEIRTAEVLSGTAAVPPPAAPDLDWSAAAPPALAAAPEASVAQSVVVQPGDTLWDLAEQDLRDRVAPATTPQDAGPTDAEIAAAWPAWWSANRQVVGNDPHLLRPGTSLAPPPAEGPQPG